MAIRRQLWFVGLVAAIVPVPVHASCTDKQMEPGWVWNYDGTIGERYRVRVSLAAMHGEVTGVHFYVTQLKDIHLQGRIVDRKTVGA
jgi:hypothetical protein